MATRITRPSDDGFNWTEELHFISVSNLDQFPQNNANRFQNVFENQIESNHISAVGLTSLTISLAGPRPTPTVTQAAITQQTPTVNTTLPVTAIDGSSSATMAAADDGTRELETSIAFTFDDQSSWLNADALKDKTMAETTAYIEENFSKIKLTKFPTISASQCTYRASGGEIYVLDASRLFTQVSNADLIKPETQDEELFVVKGFVAETKKNPDDRPVPAASYNFTGGRWNDTLPDDELCTVVNVNFFEQYEIKKGDWVLEMNSELETSSFKIDLTLSDGSKRTLRIKHSIKFEGRIPIWVNEFTSTNTVVSLAIAAPAKFGVVPNTPCKEKPTTDGYTTTNSTLLTSEITQSNVQMDAVKRMASLTFASSPVKKSRRLYADKGTSNRFLQIVCPQLMISRLAGNANASMLKLIYVENIDDDYIHVDVPSIEFAWKTFSTNLIHSLTFELYNGSGQPHPKFADPDKYIITLHCRIR